MDGGAAQIDGRLNVGDKLILVRNLPVSPYLPSLSIVGGNSVNCFGL